MSKYQDRIPDASTDTHNHPDSNQEPVKEYTYSVRSKTEYSDGNDRDLTTYGRQMLEDRKNARAK